ncbi:MAG TPA: DUF6088 family protein [Burkholderiales bacterium]|nr:DUF6088 family protein [Burkholderiales bacterium]
MTAAKRHTQVIEPKARSIIFGHRGGWVFTPKDLATLGDPRAVGMALTRLSRKGLIRQLARGLYDYPIDHPTFGHGPPSADAVAKALATREGSKVQPTGAYVANILGLSEQVPTRIVFLTNGPSRKVNYGQQEIVLKHTTPRNVATAGRKSGTVIQALRHIGQRNVNDRTLAILKRQLTDDDQKQLLRDLRYAPAWVAEIMRKLAA